MKKYIAAVFILGALFFSPKSVFAVAPSVMELTPSTGTTVTLITTGPGTLFNIVMSTGTAADQAVCYDSSDTFHVSGVNMIGTAANPELARVAVTASNTTTGLPVSGPIINFNLGLACVQSAAQRTKIYFRQPN